MALCVGCSRVHPTRRDEMGMSKRVDTCVRNVARDEDRDEDGVISRDERKRTTHASETRRTNEEEARSKRERESEKD